MFIYRYTINAKLVSKCFKDRPLPSSELVIYWSDYVLRHHEARYFNVEAHNLTWYQYMLIDAITIGILFLSISLYFTYSLFNIFYKYV